MGRGSENYRWISFINLQVDITNSNMLIDVLWYES